MENQKQKLVDKKTVQRLLIHLGIAPKTNGYGYLATAITLRLECRNAEMRMKELYARVAREFRVSAASVERCMRFAEIGRAHV